MGDTYRPSRPPPRDGPHNGPLPLMSRMTFSGGGGDSYGPGADAQTQRGGQDRAYAEFTFEAGRQGPRFPPSRPNDYNPPARGGARNGRGGRNNHGDAIPTGPAHGGRRDRNNNFSGRRGGRPFRPPPGPHQRPILQLGESTPEHVLGVADGSSKFRDLDDLSESEAEMQLDNDTGLEDASNGPVDTKKSRLNAGSHADGDSVPRWSNPDFYTAAPPPSDTTGKRKDFVSLIRKAKKDAAEQGGSRNALTANDDFISFNDDDRRAPAVFTPLNNGNRRPHPLPPPPPPPARSSYRSTLPPPPPPPPVVGSLNDAITAGALPGPPKKRAADAAAIAKPQHAQKGAKRKRGEQEGAILEEWLPTQQSPSAPWCQADHSHHRSQMTQCTYAIDGNVLERCSIPKPSSPDTTPFNVATRSRFLTCGRLHNEIMDFYDYVKPDDHENRVRENLMNRIQQTLLGNQKLPFKGRVLCFGSYPAGLYLPTADMDLVYASNQYINGGHAVIDTGSGAPQVKKMLWAAARRLEQAGIATDLTVIAKAKVPIIKFIDRITGIKVDLSFENLSGVQAQATFREWKRIYPDMPYLVALVKQFLLMRGLNDVHVGGLGGFSTICLAVSHIQLQDPPSDLGEMFLKFMECYGNFDLRKNRIVMDPPGLVNKTQWGIDGRQEKPDGLSIQDPNNPTNNISGGSNKAKDIFNLFKSAHRAIRERMDMLSTTGKPKKPVSILECLFGGNYMSYDWHRAHIKSVK
ncbi:hypothetical protein BDV96DRAFT_55357 [Lophiotrema nucula]|uniref:polynucleotide adenylyltransferase n=1 Tax=Lophiotrema nucula TaxID=690887 RepID=A0A6A5Z8H9_9PLEO|nr:hypothetical protein BDV96DRAFT_55357 [Lophiotrema nucula]